MWRQPVLRDTLLSLIRYLMFNLENFQVQRFVETDLIV